MKMKKNKTKQNKVLMIIIGFPLHWLSVTDKQIVNLHCMSIEANNRKHINIYIRWIEDSQKQEKKAEKPETNKLFDLF